MIELLNWMGFLIILKSLQLPSDQMDPLLRSKRLDRKIEFPLPNEEAKIEILQIHRRIVNLSKKGKYY